jgi:hypothetical protein
MPLFNDHIAQVRVGQLRQIQSANVYTTLILTPPDSSRTIVQSMTRGFDYVLGDDLRGIAGRQCAASWSETNMLCHNRLDYDFHVREVCWRIPLVQPWQWQNDQRWTEHQDYHVTREDVAQFVRAARFMFSLGACNLLNWPVATNSVYYSPPLVATSRSGTVPGPTCDCAGSYEQKFDLEDASLYIRQYDSINLELNFDHGPPMVGGVIGVYFVLRGQEARQVV